MAGDHCGQLRVETDSPRGFDRVLSRRRRRHAVQHRSLGSPLSQVFLGFV
ncbi:hypothetical protein HSB1_34570 [Halogranum salarium B-1]|uniref:Uncharacterized protein n=1 Tax=Halogranum salarium B-1 TaxID=1210908 RepID=J2ZBK0_9EURY|nr:hypothetical protein HSB1_34570 [Halogranum salarium B-1]